MYMSSLYAGKNLFFVNFNYNTLFFENFEKQLKNIDLILLDKEVSQERFQERYLPITDFIEKKQVCILGENQNYEKVEHLLNRTLNYGIIVGPKLSGKKVISKEFKKNLNFEVICVKTIIGKIQEKLEEEGVEVEDIENENIELEKDSQNLLEEEKEQLIQEIKEKKIKVRNFQRFKDALVKIKGYMLLHSEKQFLIQMDLSVMPEEYFAFLRATLSTPRFIIFLSISLENFLNRYKNENSLDDIEEDELPVLTKNHENFDKLKEFLISKCQTIDFVNFIEFNNDLPLEQAKENLLNIFQRDLLFFIDRIGSESSIEQRMNKELLIDSNT
jgi:hypothetical protein